MCLLLTLGGLPAFLGQRQYTKTYVWQSQQAASPDYEVTSGHKISNVSPVLTKSLWVCTDC